MLRNTQVPRVRGLNHESTVLYRPVDEYLNRTNRGGRGRKWDGQDGALVYIDPQTSRSIAELVQGSAECILQEVTHGATFVDGGMLETAVEAVRKIEAGAGVAPGSRLCLTGG